MEAGAPTSPLKAPEHVDSYSYNLLKDFILISAYIHII